jgi:hypothetical protein
MHRAFDFKPSATVCKSRPHHSPAAHQGFIWTRELTSRSVSLCQRLDTRPRQACCQAAVFALRPQALRPPLFALCPASGIGPKGAAAKRPINSRSGKNWLRFAIQALQRVADEIWRARRLSRLGSPRANRFEVICVAALAAQQKAIDRNPRKPSTTSTSMRARAKSTAC